MATLKQCRENDKIIKDAIKKVELYLKVNNGQWNNMLKLYQFDFGEKFDIENIYLSKKSVLYIASLY